MDVEIRNAEDASRYELRVDGELASIATYRVFDDNTIVFPHTETAPRWRGRGLAEQVVGRALDDARAAGRSIVPTCWFVARFVDQHPAYADLVGDHAREFRR